MFKIRSHTIMLAFVALSVMLWGMFFNLQEYEKVYAVTYSIQDNSTGGNCTSIGTWNDFTNTCTLTANITGSNFITIDSDNITLDCAGFTMTGPGSTGTGILLDGRTGVTVKNCTIQSFFRGIHLNNTSTNNTLVGNTTNGMTSGIAIGNTSDFNKLYGNTSNSNQFGLEVSFSNNTIIGNTFSSNTTSGIDLGSNADDTTITGNTIQGNQTAGIGNGILINSGSIDNTLNSNIFDVTGTTR